MIISSSFSSSSSSSILEAGSRTRTRTTTRRSVIAEVLACILILVAPMNTDAAATNELSESEIEGRDLARQLCELRPAENFTNASTLIILPGKGRKRDLREFPLRTVTTLTATNWVTVYETLPNTNAPDCQQLTVTHAGIQPNQYTLSYLQTNGVVAVSLGPNGVQVSRQGKPDVCSAFLAFDAQKTPVGALTMYPFASSDFWLADLGLEFLHWPAQKVLRHEMKRGQACKALESTNPSPSTNGYSRVVSWIDNDSGGIVHAEAYDAKNKLLKVFDPKEFKKVNGQWQLQEMEIRNVQTGSRSRLEFNLESR